jgi:signal transduction histidine kinase
VLHEFLSNNRTKLIERCRLKAAQRAAPEAINQELAHGIPKFIDQIIKTLQAEQTSDPIQSRIISGPAGGGRSVTSEIGSTARLHAHELLQHGYTVDRVVHDYGDLCQSITDLALEDTVSIHVDEFRTLNRCLDNAIADSVTEYASERDQLVADKATDTFDERIGVFAHELRNLIVTATHALRAIRTGQVGLSGPTAAVLDRSLVSLHALVDGTLAKVRLKGPIASGKLIGLADFIGRLKLSAELEAQACGCSVTVAPVHPRLAVDADPETLGSAVHNLLQNAFKFTRYGSQVSLNAYASDERILIDIEDNCGGLPPGHLEHLFRPFTQGGGDRSGVGLGLSICRRHVEANNGRVSVRDVPGTGCVFTIDLPRHLLT